MKKFWLSFLLSLPLWAAQPDCQYTYRFSNRSFDQADNVTTFGSTGSTPQIPNKSRACNAWAFMVNVEGFSVTSIAFQSAPNTQSGAAGAWATFQGTTVSGSNPTTTITSSVYTATGYYPFLRVNVGTATGTGSIDVILFGWTSPAYLSSTLNLSAAQIVAKFTGTPNGTLFLRDDGILAMPGGGASPAGSACATQIYATSSTFGGDATVGCEILAALASPAAPTVTPHCTVAGMETCMTSYQYLVSACNTLGCFRTFNVTTITNGPDTLTMGNFNTVAVVAVPNAVTYRFTRFSGGTLTTGFIAEQAGVSLNDTGLIGYGRDNSYNSNPTNGAFFIHVSTNILTIGANQIPGYQVVGGNLFADAAGETAFTVPGSDTGPYILDFLGRNGTLDNPAAQADGDAIAAIEFLSYNGQRYTQGPLIEIGIDGTPDPTVTAIPGKFCFGSVAFNANPGVSLNLRNSGNIQIGDDANNCPSPNSTVGFRSVSGAFEINNGTPGTGGNLNMAGVLSLLGNVVNPFLQTKNTQTATAPGAGKCDIRMIAGTNANTGKIVINCGTSATEVTIADNVGAGF